MVYVNLSWPNSQGTILQISVGNGVQNPWIELIEALQWNTTTAWDHVIFVRAWYTMSLMKTIIEIIHLLLKYRHMEGLSVSGLGECWWFPHTTNISNNPRFPLKHQGVPDGSDGSGRNTYRLMENQTRPITQATGRVAYLPCGGYYTIPLIRATRSVVYSARRSGVRLPLLCVWNVVTYTHHQNDTYVPLFAGVTVMR
jgi:hypothetical protein